MNNNEPNKILKSINKELVKLHTQSGGFAENYDYKKESELKEQLRQLIYVSGAIEVMSKNSLILLVALQGKLRVVPEHTFYIQFSKAAQDLKLISY